MEQNIILTPFQSVLSYIFYYKKRKDLVHSLSYYFPDNFNEPVFEVPNISEDIVDLVDFGEWVCLFDNQLDCFFAETGMDRELDFNREDEEEREFYSWIDAFKDLVRHNNSFDTVINN